MLSSRNYSATVVLLYDRVPIPATMAIVNLTPAAPAMPSLNKDVDQRYSHGVANTTDNLS